MPEHSISHYNTWNDKENCPWDCQSYTMSHQCHIAKTNRPPVLNLIALLYCSASYWVSGPFLPKQYSQFIQEVQVDAGNGPEAPGPDGGRHRPIAVIYLAALCALGITDSLSTSSTGNTTWSTPILNISADIRCNDVTNCPRIWRFDIMKPASRWRFTAAAIALSCPNLSTQNDGDWFKSLADSGAPMNSRNRGWCSWRPYLVSASTVAVPVYDVIRYGQPGILVLIKGLSSVSIGVVSASNGPSLTISRMISSAVDQGMASGETPEAYTIGTADWSTPILLSFGIL